MGMETVKKLSVASVRQRILLEALDLADGQRGTTRCFWCGAYTRGRIADGKRWFDEHMQRKHGVVVKRKA